VSERRPWSSIGGQGDVARLCEVPDVLSLGGVPPRGGRAFLSPERRHRLRERPLADGLVVMDDRQRGNLPASAWIPLLWWLGPAGSVSLSTRELACLQKIRAFEEALCAAEITDESRRAFVDQVQASALHPLDSHFTQAKSSRWAWRRPLPRRCRAFGTGTGGRERFMRRRELVRRRRAKRYCFLTARSPGDGIRYPFIQGAMSSITTSGVCLRGCDAGGLPTIALGLMDASL